MANLKKSTSTSSRFTPVKQLSIYSENKVGRLNEILHLMARSNIHIVALSSADSTDSSIVRLIVDDPQRAMKLLQKHDFTFSEVEVIAVEMSTEAILKNVTRALVEAEVNIHYIYPFLMRPYGNLGLVIRSEDNDLGMEVLKQYQLTILSQEDISR